MPHPYIGLTSDGKIPLYEFTLKTCTLYKNVPYGLAQIKFTFPLPYREYYEYSFEGIGVFCDGKLHLGPFTCQSDSGMRRSYPLMINGRPANDLYSTMFFTDNYKKRIDIKKDATDLSGC